MSTSERTQRIVSALTPRQQEMLDAIRRLRALRGHTPTVRELCAALGLRSAASGADLLDALERKGAITRPVRQRHRGVIVMQNDGIVNTAAVLRNRVAR